MNQPKFEKLIGGRYRILQAIGEGGMGEVMKGEEVGPGGFRKFVAIKRQISSPNDDPDLVVTMARRFTEEARIMGLLLHPNLVQIHNFIDEGNEKYIVMEYIQGIDVRKIIREAPKPVSHNLVVLIAVEVLKALSYIHQYVYPDGRRGKLVHRDVSPQNIFLHVSGGVKLGDMGITKGHDAPWRKGTVGNVFLGNPWYASYEATSQDPNIRIDGRHDIYSLSVVLYEMLTGKPPFRGSSSVQIHVQQKEVLDSRKSCVPIRQLRPDVSPELEAVIMRGISILRDDRFHSAEAMSDAIVASTPTFGGSFSELKALIRTLMPQENQTQHDTVSQDDPGGADFPSTIESAPPREVVPVAAPLFTQRLGSPAHPRAHANAETLMADGTLPPAFAPGPTMKAHRSATPTGTIPYAAPPAAAEIPTDLSENEDDDAGRLLNPFNVGIGLLAASGILLVGSFLYAYLVPRPEPALVAAPSAAAPSTAEAVAPPAPSNTTAEPVAPTTAVTTGQAAQPTPPVPVVVAAKTPPTPKVTPPAEPTANAANSHASSTHSSSHHRATTGFILIRAKTTGQKLRQWVDDYEIHMRDRGYEVPPGAYKVRIRRESGEELTVTVNVRAGQTKKISF